MAKTTNTHTDPFYFFSSSFGGSGLGVGSLNCRRIFSNCSKLAEEYFTYGFGRAILTSTNRLPCSRSTLEVTESLGELKRLNDNTLLLLVVAQLSVTSQGEILAERVAIETVVGHDTAQIGVAAEENTKHVVNLTLVPQGTLEKASHTGNWSSLVGVGLDTNARVEANAEHVVNDLKTLVAGGEIDSSDIGNLGELGGGVVLEEAHDGDDTGGSSVHSQLILPDGELLDVFGKTGHNVLSVGVQAVGLVLPLIGRVDDWGTERTLS